MPRFVILEHDHPELHWDFMLEVDGGLRTWRLAMPPLPGCAPIEATALALHRREYLDYEGPVRGGRGNVTRWDAGDFEGEASGTEVAVRLRGVKVGGVARLLRQRGEEWRFAWGE